MNYIFVNPKDGVICSIIDHELSLGRLIYLIKDAYPQVVNDEIKIINNGHLLSGNDEKLSDLGVSINVDRLRVIPATSWKKFDRTNF
jgi:uncharacterized ubiquitin-like protein YukD